MAMLVDVTDSTFEDEVLRSEVPVMLDLWAEWCEPCKKLELSVEKIAGKYEGKIKICRMDVSCNPRTVAQYHVMNLPTLLFIRSGEVVGQHVGSAKPTDLTRKIEGHLGIASA
ncbi:MAG: thiol reductase thioredoxin [Candidatus Eisenbacteria sp.]|nr:thiol reductase thioredoxin [Candidatus Eisenbacteria bacterium]